MKTTPNQTQLLETRNKHQGLERIAIEGTRGVGLTTALIFDWLQHKQKYTENALGVLFIKEGTLNSFNKMLDPSVFPNPHSRKDRFKWSSGAILYISELDFYRGDVNNWSGMEFNWCGFDVTDTDFNEVLALQIRGNMRNGDGVVPRQVIARIIDPAVERITFTIPTPEGLV